MGFLWNNYSIVTRESYSLEANNALLFYLFVHLFLVPSLLEGASNFCEGAKHMAEWRKVLTLQDTIRKLWLYDFNELTV